MSDSTAKNDALPEAERSRTGSRTRDLATQQTSPLLLYIAPTMQNQSWRTLYVLHTSAPPPIRGPPAHSLWRDRDENAEYKDDAGKRGRRDSAPFCAPNELPLK
jgi:hypothetical protein